MTDPIEEAAEALTRGQLVIFPTDTVYGPQWTHPHPSFSPDETKVVFASDRSGHPQVYVVEIS